MGAIVLKLQCLTNMHVGNGEVNYNIVDNEVERDPLTQYPTINASGVKGALRVFLKNKVDTQTLNTWFGAEGSNSGSGQVKILSANMLAMPVRATAGEAAYYLISTEDMKKQYENLANVLGFPVETSVVQAASVQGLKAEGIELTDSFTVDGKTIYVMKHTDFMDIPLPVIARNKLENGESKNLWYEEVVPHESIFYIPVMADDDKLLDALKEQLDNQVVQFGGNASIGYGLCKVTVGMN